MSRLYRMLWAAVAVAGLCVSQTKPPGPPTVDVELSVSKGDGRPLASSKLKLKLTDANPFGSTPFEVEAATDRSGVARFRSPAGLFHISAEAPGLGHGSAGLTEYASGKVARPKLVLLAYGAIEGTYSLDACPGNVTVRVSLDWKDRAQASVTDGRFRFTDLPPGNWFVMAFTSDGNRCADSRETPRQTGNLEWRFSLEPGQTLREVQLTPVPPPAPRPQPSAANPPMTATGAPRENKKAVWVRGIVRNEAGEHVPNATVRALLTYQGAIRRYEATSQTSADKDGRYELASEDLFSVTATLVASAPGYLPAWAWPAFPEGPAFRVGPVERAAPVNQDLVLPSKSGALEVTVLAAEKPAPGVVVTAYLQYANLRDAWAAGSAESAAIQDAAYPEATTNVEGVARFDRLLPGLYRLVVACGTQAGGRSLYGFPNDGSTAESRGIGVQVGQTTRYRMNMGNQGGHLRFRVLQDNGAPLIMSQAPFDFGPAATASSSGHIVLDPSGLGTWSVGDSGIWQVRVNYRESPGLYSPLPEPHFQAAGYVATSPNLRGEYIPTFRARYVNTGSARVVVQDIKGNPLRVAVCLSLGTEREIIGVTDEHGEALIPGLTTGTLYDVDLASSPHANVSQWAGLYAPSKLFRVTPVSSRPSTKQPSLLLEESALLPHPSQLRAQPAILEQQFRARGGTEMRVVMRAVPMRYIYGRIRPSSGESVEAWKMLPIEDAQNRSGSAIRQRADTGDFVAGPFPPGDVRLNLSAGERKFHVTVPIDGNSTEPIHFDIDAMKYPADDPAPKTLRTEPGIITLGMGGITTYQGGAQKLAGRVVQFDGATPALGAQVVYFEAHDTRPSFLAMADALGIFQPRGLWSQSNGSAGGPPTPIAVAFLPGTTGATIKPLPRPPDGPLQLTLPEPIGIRGQILVGDSPPTGRPGSIEVLAEWQGEEYLKPYLNVRVTADADGRFRLGGLTSGTYVVQASLDSIWLSAPILVPARPGETPPIELKIPLPGAPVRVELRDPFGAPRAGCRLTIPQQGPLAVLWPAAWVSDATGRIEIPTLGAGTNTVQIEGIADPVRVEVPPAPASPVIVPLTVPSRR